MTHQEMQLCDTINQLHAQLKAQLARMKEWRDTFERVGNSLTAERDAARDERDALLKALRQLCIACPSSLECNDFDHRHADRHSFTEECRPAGAYMSALEQAKAAMASSSKGGK